MTCTAEIPGNKRRGCQKIARPANSCGRDANHCTKGREARHCISMGSQISTVLLLGSSAELDVQHGKYHNEWHCIQWTENPCTTLYLVSQMFSTNMQRMINAHTPRIWTPLNMRIISEKKLHTIHMLKNEIKTIISTIRYLLGQGMVGICFYWHWRSKIKEEQAWKVKVQIQKWMRRQELPDLGHGWSHPKTNCDVTC